MFISLDKSVAFDPSFFRLPKDFREGQKIVHLTSYYQTSLKSLSTSGRLIAGKAETKGLYIFSIYFLYCYLYFILIFSYAFTAVLGALYASCH